MKKINVIKIRLLILISILVLCFNFLSFNKMSGQTDSPFCNNCNSGNSKPICSNSRPVKCPADKGTPKCVSLSGECTSVCVTGTSSDPDADFCSSTSSSSSTSSGVITPASSSGSSNLNPNFVGIWKGTDLRTNVNPNSLINCPEIQNCSNQNSSCKEGQVFLPKICTKCAHCVKASKTITLNLCISDGQLKGTVDHPGILDSGTIISQTIFTDSVVFLNLQDKNGGPATLILQLTGNKKLSGTFSYGISFDGRKSNSPFNCF